MLPNVQVALAGLNTFDNPITAPPGTLAVASNVIFSAENEAQCRPGFAIYGTLLTLTGGARIRRIWEFDSKTHVRYGDTLAYDSDGAGTWADYSGTYAAVNSNNDVQPLEYFGTAYLNTTTGVKRLDAVGGTWAAAGMPPGIEIKAVLSSPASPSSGWFATGHMTAYRVVWKRIDANKRVILGAPSGRADVTNAAGDRDITLTVPIPTGVVAGDYLQVYRAKISGGATSLATDDMYLAAEITVTSTHITATSITVVDDVKQDALGAYLYTSETQEGIQQANFRPPVCRTMAMFRDSAIYANTRQPHRLKITLVKVFKSAVSPGLTSGNQLVISGVTYTADSTSTNEVAATGTFWVDEAGADAAIRIRNTCLSLCRVVNGNSSNTTVYAYFLGNYTDTSGIIVFERRDFTDTAFVITAATAAAGNAFLPALPTTGTTLTSSSSAAGNALSISKPYQPDAVPLANELSLGQEGENILLAIPSRSALWLFTDKHKTYRMTGTGIENFVITLYDSTLQLYGPRTAAAVGDGIICMTSQGIMLLTDSGYREIGRAIHDKTQAMLSLTDYPNFERDSYAVAIPSSELWLLQHASTFLVYCWSTGNWSTWSLAADAGNVSITDGKLYLTKSTGYVYAERKAETQFDFADQNYTVTISSNSEFEVVLSALTNVVVGQALYQSTTKWAIIKSIVVGTKTLTLDRIHSWTAGSASVYDPIACQIEWNPNCFGMPNVLKRFREIVTFWRFINAAYTITVSTNFEETNYELEVTPTWRSSEYGVSPYGDSPYGGTGGGAHQLPARVPVSKIRALWLNIGIKTSIPFLKFQFNGVGVVLEKTGTRWNAS